MSNEDLIRRLTDALNEALDRCDRLEADLILERNKVTDLKRQLRGADDLIEWMA